MSIRKVICEYIYLDITKNHHYYDEVGYYYLDYEFIIQTFSYIHSKYFLIIKLTYFYIINH